jgi:hypothetical protein
MEMEDTLKSELAKLKCDIAIATDKAISENGNVLGKALKMRFEVLESVILILAKHSPPEIQEEISRELANRNAHWLR